MTGWITSGDVLHRGSAAKDRRSVAVHEAGHAVVAHLLGQKVLRVWLVDGRPRNGYTTVEYKTFARKSADPIVRAIVAIAGHEAEHRIYGRPISLLPAEDYKAIKGLGCGPVGLAGPATSREGSCDDTRRQFVRLPPSCSREKTSAAARSWPL